MDYDCIVLGTGNAGLCAAIAAVEAGCNPARVLVIDKAPVEWAGGNSFFTAGAFRTVHGGLQDLLPVVRSTEKDQSRLDMIDMDTYTEKQFSEDIERLGNGRANMKLVDVVVKESRDVIGWLSRKVGIRFMFSSHRQAYEVKGRLKFWGGMVLAVQGGGKSLVEDLIKKVNEMGIQLKWETTVVGFLLSGQRVRGVEAQDSTNPTRRTKLTARGVVLASGGFEAEEAMRVKYLGPTWNEARVRGTPFNKGDGIKLVLGLPSDIRPQLVGDWSGCHSTCWDFNSPTSGGSREMTNQYTKSGYTLGLMLNAQGQRYVDEGADYRNFTYAVYGKATLAQPGGFAFQLWDNKTRGMLRAEEYADDVTRRIEASSIEELANMLRDEGLEAPSSFVKTILEYNEAVRAFGTEFPDKQFDPAVKDGLGTQSSAKSLEIPKSNWALTLEVPPFVAVKITCGVTFTFGGLPIDPSTANVLAGQQKIDGLFCAGEMVGDLFWGNYPGGSGLTAGAVFGRRAGREIGRLVTEGIA